MRLFNRIDPFMHHRPAELRVLLLGGRAGKTSLLSVMHQDIDHLFYGSPYTIMPEDGDTSYLDLLCKHRDLQDYFSKRYMTHPFLIPNAPPAARHYEYTLQCNYDALIRLHFTDFPSAYLDHSDKEALDWLLEEAAKSDVILIGVHTPALMEEIQPDTGFGKYHMELNRVNEITQIIKNSLSRSEKEHLVLFVPLQCEKYYRQNRMKKIPQAIHQGYRELLACLTHSEQITVAVSPALTLGGIEFLWFEDNSPRFCYVLEPYLKYFNPRHCCHFLSLILLYAYYQLERHHSLSQGCLHILPDPKFFAFRKMQKCLSDLHSLEREQAGPGFSILHDPKQSLRISDYTQNI